jgi:predicted ATPase
MNEQLIVKNFGPIKDATVDFKRVTVFIGPTGGGKSTLAKLATIFRTDSYSNQSIERNGIVSIQVQSNACLEDYGLGAFKKIEPFTTLISEEAQKFFNFDKGQVDVLLQDGIRQANLDSYAKSNELVEKATNLINEANKEQNFLKKKKMLDIVMNLLKEASTHRISASETVNSIAYKLHPVYIPSERSFVASISSSLAGLMRDDIGLPKPLLNFTNAFFQSQNDVTRLEIPFLGITYFRLDNKDYVVSSSDTEQTALLINQTASGIQSVTPLLVLLEHLSRNTEQAQSFIIEEPELNLYPTAQQGLLNWLVEKCTQGENDLTITTHSPYILSSCNLLLEAYKVAQLRPDLEEEIAAIVPKACWLNPDEFAAYYVADGTVKPITDERTHLIGGNELDAVSGDISDSFRKLLRLKKQAV